jgi:YfiR/HmsC-like
VGLACLWLAGGWAAGDEKSGGVGEYQVKAAFLYNFTKFTDWPASAFSSTNAPLVIGILGDDPFGPMLDEVVRGEVVRAHPLVVKRLGADEDLRSCQILFISRSEKHRLPALLSQLKGSPVLTVSDASDFAEQGGMVNFRLVQKTVKLEINQAATEAASLQISGKLLKLARIVQSK